MDDFKYLKLNDDKTEVIIVGTKAQLRKSNINTIDVCNSKMAVKNRVKNIGVHIDSELTMKYHVNHISSVAWCHLRNLFRIRRHLTTSHPCTRFVTSRLDLYNCLLYKCPNTMKNKLQRILNCSAKLIFHGKKYDSVTPLLKKLHWLPVEQRIQFKILLTTFKCLNGKGPSYLTDLLIQHTPHRVLRSFGNSLLTVNLPIDIRSCNSVDSFKKKLKTHLFEKAYGI